MKRRRFSRRAQLAGAGALLFVTLTAIALTSGPKEEAPASRAVLNGIALKNRAAAVDAAAQFKEQAASTSQAAELQAQTSAPESEGTDADDMATDR